MKDIGDRIIHLNEKGIKDGKYVLYWMQAAQRTLHNHALEHSIRKGNEMDVPVVVCFGIDENYPEANERHFRFMLEGLSEVQSKLKGIDIKLVLRKMIPWKTALELSKDASMVICDRGYLRHQIDWRKKLAEGAGCSVVQVESDVVFPVEKIAEKEMYSAAQLRRRIEKALDAHLHDFKDSVPERSSLELDIGTIDLDDIDNLLAGMDIDKGVGPVSDFKGGTSHALIRLRNFIEKYLDIYHTERNDPSKGIQSDLSPYLHFGQISPLTIALAVGSSGSPGSDAFLEELIVRRELAFNFVHYNGNYDNINCLPDWARGTLEEHKKDTRKYKYSRDELENASTHDPYWNAAQREMVSTGKMHNYMRMYWGKKILEWTEDPSKAYDTALYLNNKFNLDGRDPNSFAGVAWCFGKHDRPWTERKIFGKVRYMNDNGLKRKFDIEKYVKNVEG